VIRTALRVLLFIVAAGVLLVVGALIALHAGADTWVVNSLVRRVVPGATSSVGDVAGNYFSGIELRDVRVVRDGGAAPWQCDTIRASYDLRKLLSGDITIHRVQLIDPLVALHQSSTGSWNPFPSPKKPGAAGPRSRPPAVVIQQFSIIGGMASVRSVRPGDPLAVRVAGEGSLAWPRLMLNRLVLQSDSSSVVGSGWITLPRGGEPLNLGAVNLDVEATPLAFRDLRGFHSGMDREGSVRLKGRIRGDGSQASVTLEVAPSTGGTLDLQGELTPPKRSPVKYRLDAELHSFDVGPFLGRPVPLRPIDGKIGIDLWGDQLARLNGKARVELSDRGRTIRATAELDQGRARVDLLGSLGVASTRISGWVRPFDTAPAYDLRAHLQPTHKGTASAGYHRWLGEPSRSVALRIRGRGLPPNNAVGWATARIQPVSGGAALLDSGSVGVRVNGRSARLVASAGLASGLVTLAGTGAWGSQPRLRIERGALEAVDVAALLGDSSWTPVSGRFSLDLNFTSGGAQLALRSQLNEAALNVKARGSTSGLRRTLSVPQLSFQHLDLGRFRSNQTITDLNGTGWVRAAGGKLKTALITGQLRLEESRIGDEKLRRAQVAARLEHGAIRTRGDIYAHSGRLAFSGSARPFDSLPSYRAQEISFSNLDLGRLLKQERFRTRLAGSLSSEGIGRSAEDARLSGTLNLRRSTVDSTTIERGRIEATLKEGQLEIVGMLRGQRDSVLVGAALSPLEDHPSFTLITRVPISELASILQPHRKQDADGVAYLALTGEWGHPDSMKLQGELQAEGRLGELRLDTLGATLQLRQGVARLDSFSLRSNVATAGGSGLIGLFGSARSAPARLSLSGRFADLAPLAPYVGVADIGLDSGTVRIGAEGNRDTLRLNLSLKAHGLATGEKSIGELVGSARGQLAGSHLSSGTAELSARGIRSGKSSFRSILIQGSSRGDQIEVRGEALIDSHSDARVVARVHRGDHGNQVQLDTLNARIDRNRWALSHPVRISYGDRIRVDDFVLASGAHRIAVNGVIDRRGEQAFQVKIDSLRFQRIAQALGLGELGGELNMSASLTGPARSPNFHGDWDLAVQARDQAVGTARGRADWRSDGLTLDAKITPVKSDSLTVKGRLPFALSLSSSDSTQGLVTRIPGGELALDAVGRAIDMRKFQPLFDEEKIRDLRGKLSVDAHARGSLDRPQLSGNITLREAKVRIPSLGKTYKGELKLDLKRQEARVAQARIESGKGRVGLTGTIGMGAFPATLDLTSQLRDFRAASAEEFRASISGNLHLRGTIKAPILTGALQLHNTDFYLQAKNLQHSAEAVELTPEELKLLEQRFGPEVARRSQESRPPLYAWGLGLDVALSQNNWLRRRSDPVMAVELSGKVSVRKKPSEELQLFGQIQPVVGRSFVQLMSRRFDLKTGTFELTGPLNQARLELDAEYSTTAAGSSTPVVIIAAVKSDTGKLDVSLVSRPMMPNADIISYLTTGRPASTDPTLKSDEQGVLATGASLAFGAALGSVAGRAGQSLGLDVVQVLQDRQGGQTVVGGKYVSPPLYLGFRQPIVPPSNSARSTSQQQEAVEFEVEYATLRQMLLNIQGGGSDIRVFLRLRR
jgi:translocation and assembly module TamB